MPRFVSIHCSLGWPPTTRKLVGQTIRWTPNARCFGVCGMESMDPAVLVTVTLPCYKDHLALDPWIAPPHGRARVSFNGPPKKSMRNLKSCWSWMICVTPIHKIWLVEWHACQVALKYNKSPTSHSPTYTWKIPKGPFTPNSFSRRFFFCAVYIVDVWYLPRLCGQNHWRSQFLLASDVITRFASIQTWRYTPLKEREQNPNPHTIRESYPVFFAANFVGEVAM